MSGVSAVQHVFVVGSKGIPGSYGGYETFVDRLTEYHEGEPGLRYHVACKSLSESGEFSYHNARCFRVRVPQIGPAQAIWYDVAALADCVAYIRRNRIPHPIVYVLACRIGPFTAHFARGPPSGRQTVREPGRARVDAREVERAGAQVLEGVRADDDEAR